MLLLSHTRGKVCSRRSSTGFLLSLVLAVASHAQQGAAPSTSPDIRTIVTEVQQKRFDDALKEIKSLLEKNPKDVRLLTLRGVALSSMHQPVQALAALDYALELSPAYLPALEAAAQLKYEAGGSGAGPYLLKILALRPADPTSHAMLGAISYRAKDCDAAVSQFEQAASAIAAQPVALAQYGTCLGLLKRPTEAIPVLQRSLALDPAQEDVRYNLALCQRENGQADMALETLQPLFGAAAKSEKPMLLAAEIDEAAGQSQRAIDILRQAIAAFPSEAAAYLEFAYLAYNHGSPKVGIDFLNIGITQLPKNGRLYLVRGILYCQIGDVSQAMQDFQKANSLDPGLSFVQAAMGIAQSQQHRSPEAIAQFREAARQHPDEALTQYLLAEALSEQPEPEERELVAAATRALTLDPRLTAAHDLLAGVYLQRGQKERAAAESEAALKVDPADQQALYHLILSLRDSPRKAEIADLMSRLNEARKAESSQASDAKQRVFQFSEVPDAHSSEPQSH